MKPQTIGLSVAAAVTGVFMLAVGVVLAWNHFDFQPRQQPRNQQVHVLFNNNIDNNVAAPGAAVDNMIDRPIAQEELKTARGVNLAAKDYKLSGPLTHANLSIFLIHGANTVEGQDLLTLQEGLERNVVVVHETGAGQLFIDNRTNVPLFIQAGDIVKGGTQDRVLPYDMVVSAHSTRTPIAALCVEQGRSFPRGNEVSTSFQTSNEQLPTRSLKLAATRRSQQDVWNNVKNLQANLARNTGGTVEAAQSQTSLQLSLEHPRVQSAVLDYVTPLGGALEGKDDVVGFAVVVNGKVHTADVYGSSVIFRQLWPKLLRASAVDALAERQPNLRFDALDDSAVQAFLLEAESGRASRVRNCRTETIRQDSTQAILLDTCDTTQANAVLHRAYLAK